MDGFISSSQIDKNFFDTHKFDEERRSLKVSFKLFRRSFASLVHSILDASLVVGGINLLSMIYQDFEEEGGDFFPGLNRNKMNAIIFLLSDCMSGIVSGSFMFITVKTIFSMLAWVQQDVIKAEKFS